MTQHPKPTAPQPIPVVDPADSAIVRNQALTPEPVPAGFRELERFVLSREDRTIVGIAGAPAKSTAATRLVADWNDCHRPDGAAYLPMDGFHLSNAQLDQRDLQSLRVPVSSTKLAAIAGISRKRVDEPSTRWH